MPSSALTPTKPKKLLIITSSGGGGLIQVANAKGQEAKAKDPYVVIIRCDIMRDWVLKGLGQFFTTQWNRAQLKGNVHFQSFFGWVQFLADYFLWPNVFLCALYTFFKEEVDEVIDTQPIGTSAILTALRIYNRKRSKQVRLDKVLVDLPTEKATHFFAPIKKLSKKSRPFLRLTTTYPLLEEGQTGEQFWQKNCRLSEKEVNYEALYVREAFHQFRGKAKIGQTVNIRLTFKNLEELQLMQSTYERGGIVGTVEEGIVEFKINPLDKMATILLGSQPANNSTFNYVKKFIQVARDYPDTILHLFVFCADHQVGRESLLRKVAEFVKREENYPKNLSIIPFSFQNEEAIAPLFFRSDVTCTRSGGSTAMELMCVSSGKIWIHSEAVGSAPSIDQLLRGIPGWESANALYLHKLKGAKLVTPETVGLHASDLFHIDGELACSKNQIVSSA